MPLAAIAPSILSADMLNLAAQLQQLEAADSLHLDVMDGHFVPNITFGPDLVRQVHAVSRLPLDVHLMVADPDRYLQAFAEAGASVISVHAEVCTHLHRTVAAIRDLGVQPSVALNPATPLESLEWVVPDVDQVLIMTVNPGFGGQRFIPQMLDKVRRLARWREERGARFRIQVDGGVNGDTLAAVVEAGADVAVIGSALFSGRHGSPAESLAFFRRVAAAARGG